MSVVSYRSTKIACYLGYITQAISINLSPLLYVTFQKNFDVTLSQLGMLATVIFVIQIAMDLLAARFGKHISFRVGCVAAHVFATIGLLSMAVLPQLLPNPYVGLLLAAILLSVGGGLTEVLISPVIDAIPGDAKAGEMSLLHSFYCWGIVGVILLSTAFFAAFGTDAWQWLVALWALIPAVTTALFALVPLPPKPEETAVNKRTSRCDFGRWFGLAMVLMICAGATEMGLAQWVSLFAERGLRISKIAGDLLGPCAFALFQGASRVVYGRMTARYDGRRLLMWCAVGCVIGYALVIVAPWPLLALLGFCLCGWFVGPMWPGILSLSSARYPLGGTAMFAVLALCGDVGCSAAPALIGVLSDHLQLHRPLVDALRGGFAVCLIFPIVLLIGLLILHRRSNPKCPS